MKILVSWYAKNNDFDREGEVSPQGPTLQFHKYFYKGYDQHVLLSTRREESGDPFLDQVKRAIERAYKGHVIQKRYLNVTDVIDFRQIKTKVEALLLEYKDHEIDIFFSPGTSAMQLSWYACHQSLGLKTRLLQTREGKHTGKKEPDLIELKVEQSTVPRSIILSEQKQQKNSPSSDYLIGESIVPVYEKARMIAQTDRVTCLIRGASGTGKEHLANYLHQESSRSAKSFVAINCSALNDNLLESRLFGHAKGAYTGATENKKGLLEEADGGTVFLDEIGDISPYMQQSLLRVLQSAEILPVGENKARKIDVRIVSATHRNLEQMCEEGTFRWDLYFRLAVVELTLPTLQERGSEEKRKLIEFFLKKIKDDLGKPQRLALTKEAMQILLDYPFGGNIRELENVITNLHVFCEGEATAEDVPRRLSQKSTQSSDSFHWKDTEKNLIVRALDFHKGNQRRACKALGYGSINTLRKKMGEYGV
jgi:transcriptional regulator with PAS, ATPase and Fis domain